MSRLLNIVGLDGNDNYIFVSSAIKGIKYRCPECKHDLILKINSGKPNSKTTHFAHKILNPNCTPEGILHRIFKEILFKIILKKIGNNEKFDMKWMCEYTKGFKYHKGNLLNGVSAAKKEKNIDKFRPDISLYNKDGNPISVIEVMVTHFPTKESKDYYHNNNINLISFYMEDYEPLEELLSNPIINPNGVSIPSFRGEKCGYCKKKKNPTRAYL